MIDYYFTTNDDDAAIAFADSPVAYTGLLKRYVKSMLDYLQQEYNTPFTYFLGFTTVEDICAACEADTDMQAFVDEIMQRSVSERSNILIYGDKKTIH